MEYLTQSLLALSNPQAAEEILSLWNEYENGETPEAIFVKDGTRPFLRGKKSQINLLI